MKKYNALIIGCGAQGCGVDQEKNPNKIINFAHALTEHEGFELKSFFDTNINKSKKAIDIWENTTHYFSLNNAIELENIDVAIITTPDNQHYKILKQLAEYPLKLVICEKPICEDLRQAREIVELYKTKGIPLMVNYTRRFLPVYEEVKEFGEPIFGICNFNRGWIHSATHGIDFFNMIGCKNYKVIESHAKHRVWYLEIFYKKRIYIEERFGEQPVWDYYDKSHMHIINNAYEFLEGREEIKCTGEMALRSLEICFNLMENNPII